MAVVLKTFCAVAFLVGIATLTTWYFEVNNPALILFIALTDFVLNFINISLSNPKSVDTDTANKIFTRDSLRKYDGTEGSQGLHLAFLGRVYDVSGKGDIYYAPGGGYSFFAGRDATRAFITGQFNEEGLKDDVDGFNEVQMGEVMGWVDFYEREYVYVGVIEGRYYDNTGQPTEERKRIDDVFLEIKNKKMADAEEKFRYQSCKIQEDTEGGSPSLSCVKIRSADEKETTPPRYPRKYFKPGVDGWRCACVLLEHLNSDLLAELKICHAKARVCKVVNSDWEGFYTGI